MNFDMIKTLIAESAAESGITEYEIYESEVSNVSAQTLGHEISSLKSSVKGGICVRCRVNGKMGYASTQLFEEAEIKDLIRRASENAEGTEKEDEVGIFEGSPSYNKPEAKPFEALSADKVKEIALALQKATYEASDKVIHGTRSVVQTTQVVERLVNSYGLDLVNDGGLNFMYSAAVVNDQGESVNSFHMGIYGKDDIKTVGEKAVESALSKIGAGTVKTGKYNIIIDAEEMCSLLAVFSSGFSAKAAQMGVSRLAGKEGEKIASDLINITDDPAREGADITSYFDAEGVAAYRKDIVKDGILQTLLYNRETAKKAGKETTGNASKASYASPVEISPYAFCIEAGKTTADELFAMAGNGIYITEVKGLHAGANAVTGDFSVESAGFLIENGKKTSPVKTFTIAGNFFEVLRDVAAIGDDLYLDVSGGSTMFGSPSILLRDMSIAGE